MKTKTIPFDLETAKKIQAGEIEGRIVTDKGASARILCYDFKCGEYSIGAAISVRNGERFCCITNSGLRSTGEQMNDGWFDKLLIELPEEALKHEFKPFEKVLVRENNGQVWHCDFYSYIDSVHGIHYCVGHCGKQILPYEGNENLVGTIDKPKEE